jgi:hypothetical protein
MVAQFPVTITTPAKNLTPQISVDVKTFTEFSQTTILSASGSTSRMCVVSITITNLNKSLAVATFDRVFAYVQSLAINDINPIPNINLAPINPGIAIGEFSRAYVQAEPETGITLSIDSSELISVCAFTLKISGLRLDYMDEYFNSTLAYLTNVIAHDLNP